MKPAAPLAVIVALLAALGCGRTRGDLSAPAGEERGPCLPNGTCDPGLSCFSNRCVRYDQDGAPLPPDAAGDTGGASGGGGGAVGGQGGQGALGAGGSGGTVSGQGGQGGAGTGGTGDTGGPDAAADSAPEAREAGAPFCDGAATGPTETIVAQACGYSPGTTTAGYSGFVGLTVSGVLVNTGTIGQDAFYSVDVTNDSVAMAACPDCFRYNRLSEGACVCRSGCPGGANHEVGAIVVGGYPDFRPDHVYSVVLDLGGPADQLDLGMADCGCNDNSGTYVLELTPLTAGTCNP